jgi:opacity protein-like surface antigen
MSTGITATLAFVGLLGFAGVAQAADVAEAAPPAAAPVLEATPSWYLAARAGVAFPLDTNFDFGGANVHTDYDTGFVGGVAIGTQFNVGSFAPRAEVEFGYMRTGVDTHQIDGFTVPDYDSFGHENVFYGLVNGYLDFGSGPLKPYIGAGVGFGHVEFDNYGVGSGGGNITALDDSGTGFAWQVGAGLSYAWDAHSTIELGYRYFSVENVGVTANDLLGSQSDVDVRAHQVMLGFRYAF